MSEKAIAKTGLRGRRLLTDAKGAPALEHLADVRRAAGARLAALFARPDFTTDPNTGDTTITWYHGASGDARPLRTLPPVARERVEQRLRDALAPAMGDLNDAVRGPVLGRALHVANPDAIWAVGETPVLIDWGIVPEDVGLQQEDRASLYAQTLGQFAPLAGPPPIGDGGLADATAISADGDDGHRASRGSAAPEAASVAAAASQSQPAGEKEKVFIRPMVHWLYWVPLMVLIVLLLSAILWLLLPGNRLFPVTTPIQSEEAAKEEALLKEENQALIDRIERLREAREGAVCRADGALELPGGHSPEGALLPPVTEPGAETQEPPSVLPGKPDALVTPAPERVIPTSPESGGEAPSADTATLNALIESSTVVVLGKGPNGTSLGSGFFIGPDLVITNHHVIDGMTQTFVTGASLGEVARAEVLASKGPFETTGGDFALLRVAGVQNQAFTVRLPSVSSSLRLNNVYAAGFPDDVMSSDAQFQGLVSGDGTAVPDVFITTGIVNSEQDWEGGERVILHSAAISSGNSGGPLLDACGQVIGVNTFVRTGPMRSVNIALTTQAMSAFLQQNGHAVTETTASCEPRLLNAAAPPPTADGTADPQGPAE